MQGIGIHLPKCLNISDTLPRIPSIFVFILRSYVIIPFEIQSEVGCRGGGDLGIVGDAFIIRPIGVPPNGIFFF